MLVVERRSLYAVNCRLKRPEYQVLRCLVGQGVAAFRALDYTSPVELSEVWWCTNPNGSEPLGEKGRVKGRLS